jgi:hypothetical protein
MIICADMRTIIYEDIDTIICEDIILKRLFPILRIS